VVRLTRADPCDPEAVETRTVETGLFVCRLSVVRDRRLVPGAVLLSGTAWSSASGSVSDSV